MSGCGFFFFNDTATTEIYTLSLHDALPIYRVGDVVDVAAAALLEICPAHCEAVGERQVERSEEHTSELQSQSNLVCRLLLEKKTHQYQSLTQAQPTKAATPICARLSDSLVQ